MAKNSKKRSSRYPGCVPSLLNIFDFRRGRSTVRLLPDRRPPIRNTDAGHLSNGNGTEAIEYGDAFERKEDSEAKEKPMPENAGICVVKELIEVEITSEGGMSSLPDNSQMSLVSGIHTADCLNETKAFNKLEYETIVEASNLPYEKPGNTGSDGSSIHKHQKFFRGRSRSLESFLEGGNEDFHSSSIVPSDTGASLPSFYMYTKLKDERFASSRFSFTELKKKLWHALGKDKNVISSECFSMYENRKNCGKHKNFGWSSPNRNHFYSERFILSTGNNGELVNRNDTSGFQKLGGEFNLYVEAKKHIYEMLKDADEDSYTTTKKLPKSLGMILDAPDPTEGEVLESLSSIGSQSSVPCTISGEIADTAHGRSEEMGDVIESTCESFTSSTDGSSHQYLIGEDQMLSSPAVSASQSPVPGKAEGYKSERHSPVSVLESSFIDDASSPACTTSSEPVVEMEAGHVNFKEEPPTCNQGIICKRISMENEESPYEYVEAVLLGSGLNWDDFHWRWLSSHEILDSSLFEEVKLFSNRNHHDQHLLFDSANEALMGLCDVYFGKKPPIQHIPASIDLIDEIWRWIEWHLLRHTETNSMDQLIQFDFERSGKWMNLHQDMELISFEIEVTILDELMEEITLSFQEEVCTVQGNVSVN